MKKMTVLPARTCSVCPRSYIPKPGGHNSLYCSKACKRRQKPKRIYDPAKRSHQYHEVVKRDPVRLAKHQASANANRREVCRWLAEYKVRMGCVDCGYNKHSAALQLDHEGKKTKAIADCRSSIATLQKEIEDGQCKVRCANCHSIRTFERKQKLKETV